MKGCVYIKKQKSQNSQQFPNVFQVTFSLHLPSRLLIKLPNVNEKSLQYDTVQFLRKIKESCERIISVLSEMQHSDGEILCYIC